MDLKLERTQEYIVAHGDFTVLSSACYHGGFLRAKTIINRTVATHFDGDAVAFFDSYISELGLDRAETVGMMTAVAMVHAQIVEKENVTAIITAGINNAHARSDSTVNIMLLLNRNLSRAAMANVLIVATEAKAAAFYDLEIRARDGELMTGDATDSVVVACYGRESEPEELYAGKATDLGQTVYEVVRAGVKDALSSYNGLRTDRPILERLEERGITMVELVETALALYVPVAGEQRDRDSLEEGLARLIRKECADPNVALLLAAAIHTEEEEIRTGRAGDAGAADAACIVADELIGIDIAEYIGGKKALFNFVYYDTRKPGILGRLGVFLDDAIGGLIAGCMTKLLE
jgi:alpha-ribazole phosphatase CobZ